MGVLLPRVQCKCFFPSLTNSILYLCCMYQRSFCIPLLASHFYTVLRPDHSQNRRSQTQTRIRPPHHRPSQLMLLVVGNNKHTECDLIGCGRGALQFFTKPNSNLAIKPYLLVFDHYPWLASLRCHATRKFRKNLIESDLSYANQRFRGANTREIN